MIDDRVKDAGVQACVEYDRCASEIRRLGREIGEALDGCARAQEDGGKNHLAEAYAEIDDGPEDVRFLDEQEQLEILSACPACLRAHQLIQERRALRRRWGVVKRRLRTVAKRALAPDPHVGPDPLQVPMFEEVARG